MTSGILNPTHIAIVLIIALLILGPRKLPQTGRSLGRGMREFKQGITGRDDSPAAAKIDPVPAPTAAAPPPEPVESAAQPTADASSGD